MVYFKTAPVFSWRRLTTICVYGFTVYYALKYIPRLAGFEISVELDDEEEEEQKDETAEETDENKPKRLEVGVELTSEDLEADEDSIFIPMTWAEKLPRTFYKGSDPEWQEFLKVSKNPDRIKTIMQDLLDSFSGITSANPVVARQLGPDAERGKHWLDVTFPDGPPQEYVRSGLEIGDGFIAWSRQRITSETQHRLARALWPTALFKSLTAYYHVLSRFQLRQLSESLGYPKTDSGLEQGIKAMEALLAKGGEKKVKEAPEGVTPPQTVSAGRVDATTERTSKALWPLPAAMLPSIRSTGSVNSAQPDVKMALATHVFARTLSKGLSNKKIEAPRGTFFVHGLIEMRGKVGRMLFDVIGIYDPKQSRYVAMHAAVKSYKRAKQGPRGGD